MDDRIPTIEDLHQLVGRVNELARAQGVILADIASQGRLFASRIDTLENTARLQKTVEESNDAEWLRDFAISQTTGKTRDHLLDIADILERI